jgi:predicted phage terminase large subunit-like protein
MSREELEKQRVRLSSYVFEAQYQQRPAPLGGGIIKWEWFQFYDRPPVQRPGDMIVQSWDPAQSISEGSDWSVCTTWLVPRRVNHFYLLEVQRFRAEAPELLDRIVQSARDWPANLVLMETVGHGQGLYQQACRKTGCNMMPFKPKGDKVSRMVAESPAIEAGYVYLPRKATWMPELQREFVNFPKARHDDQVDSMSQFLYWARMRGPNRPKLECRLTFIGGEPDLDAHLADLW